VLAKKGTYGLWLGASCLLVFTLACALSPSPTPTQSEPSATASAEPTSAAPPATQTPTPTPSVQGAPAPANTVPATRCQGLNGSIELQVLVGPAEIVGLEPFAVGSVPFSVTTPEEPYVVEGAGPIAYQDVLTENWGTYEVTMDLNNTINGTCSGAAGSETLQVEFTMSGSQMVEVNAEDLHGEYPWEGEHTVDATFPLEEGAAAEGEGWALILHLQ